MSPIANLVLLAWIPLVFYFFVRFPPRQAVVVSFVVGFLFLPERTKFVFLHPLPPYSKSTACIYLVLLATAIYDSDRFKSFKLGWADIPMLLWSLNPLISQSLNGLSPISPLLGQIFTWWMPYFIGRIYFNSLAGLRQLAIGIMVGGAVYVPFCWFEMRMSPNLHRWVYGYPARLDFAQAIRMGGYRPVVFLTHGLWVAVWMMAATIIAFWLWQTGAVNKVRNIPINRLAIALLVTFIFLKSTGAYIYVVLGFAILLIGRWLGISWTVLILSLGICAYMWLGATGNLYSIPQVVSFMENANDDRSGSLAFRMKNEELLSEKARERMLFGWGASGGGRIYNEWGEDISVTDSIWIIAFSGQGAIGLALWSASFFVPLISFLCFRYPASTWSKPQVAPAAALALSLVLYMLDSVLNAMFCPIWNMACGGIAGVLLKEPEMNQSNKIASSAVKRKLSGK